METLGFKISIRYMFEFVSQMHLNMHLKFACTKSAVMVFVFLFFLFSFFQAFGTTTILLDSTLCSNVCVVSDVHCHDTLLKDRRENQY